MALPLLAIVIIVVVILYLIFKLINSVMRTAMIGLCIAAVVFLASAFIIANDVKDLKQNYANSSKLFLAIKEETVISGFAINDSFSALSKDELIAWSDVVKKDKVGDYASSTKKIFVINDSVLKSDPTKKISLDNETYVERIKLYEALVSGSIYDTFGPTIGVTPEVLRVVYAENDLNARILGYLVQDTLGNSTSFAISIKKGEIILYPQLAAFRLLRYLPNPIVEQTLNRAFEKEAK